MRVGVVRELKEGEPGVGLLPREVAALVAVGHTVLVETCCGSGITIEDEDYTAAGAKIVSSAEEVFALAQSSERS